MSEPTEPLLSKSEACAALGKSPRSIANYVSGGELAVRYVQGKAFFAAEDVERLKAQLAMPTLRAVPAPEPAANPTALALAAPKGGEAVQQFLAAILQAQRPPVEKPWLTLAEAVEYSGLPAAFLLKCARDRSFRAVNVGTGAREFWRFNREGLSK